MFTHDTDREPNKKLRIAVAVNCKPGDFDGGKIADDGTAWRLFGELYPTNPRYQLTEGDIDMINLWRLFQGGGMGSGHLPESGGVMEQPAIMMDAFAIMDRVEREFKENYGHKA